MFSDLAGFNGFCFSRNTFLKQTSVILYLIPEDLLLQTLPSVLTHQGDPERKKSQSHLVYAKLTQVFYAVTKRLFIPFNWFWVCVRWEVNWNTYQRAGSASQTHWTCGATHGKLSTRRKKMSVRCDKKIKYRQDKRIKCLISESMDLLFQAMWCQMWSACQYAFMHAYKHVKGN